MAIKVFVLGRPGSGKSAVARYIAHCALNKGWTALHINDYEILQEMFRADTQQKQFRPTVKNGFDVVDFSVLDVALKKVEEKVRSTTNKSPQKKEIIIVEFARDDYRKALRLFDPDFLRDSYFIFLDAEMDTCMQRIHDRVANPIFSDDHFVSDEILTAYYNIDNRHYMAYRLKKDYRIGKCIKIILNTGSLWDLTREVYSFLGDIFKWEAPEPQKVSATSKSSMHKVVALATASAR